MGENNQTQGWNEWDKNKPNKNTTHQGNEKLVLGKKLNKIDKPLAKLTKRWLKIQISKIRGEKEGV